jgi:clan AA aspartic protease
VIGRVDDRGRALLDVSVSNAMDGPGTLVTAWIDTAFDGHLVFSTELIGQLGLEPLATTEAVLADGLVVSLNTYLCYVEWFGSRIPLQVIENAGKLPLLGTGLLDDRVLHVDYKLRQLSVD